MTDRLDVAIKIVEETCPQRRLKLENIKSFSEIIRCRKFHKGDILRFESAKDRYTKLMNVFPEIIRRAPLTYVASYLQMSLETLSRVRASISTQP